MAGYNVSLYLNEPVIWDRFKEACEKEGKRPNTILRNFIEQYSEEVLGSISLEHQIAKGMLEAQKIAKGEITGRRATDLLDEI